MTLEDKINPDDYRREGSYSPSTKAEAAGGNVKAKTLSKATTRTSSF